jgi:hypothetical protein
MTQKELEMFKSLKEKLEHETIELFDYIKKKYLDVLEFGRYSSYHHYNMNDEIIWIEYFDYGYDCYDSRDIDIPINDFLSDPFKWADNWANNIRIEKQKKKDKAIKEQEEKEKKELQRLKDKYENQLK